MIANSKSDKINLFLAFIILLLLSIGTLFQIEIVKIIMTILFIMKDLIITKFHMIKKTIFRQ